jgi:hypothetical protein
MPTPALAGSIPACIWFLSRDVCEARVFLAGIHFCSSIRLPPLLQVSFGDGMRGLVNRISGAIGKNRGRPSCISTYSRRPGRFRGSSNWSRTSAAWASRLVAGEFPGPGGIAGQPPS